MSEGWSARCGKILTVERWLRMPRMLIPATVFLLWAAASAFAAGPVLLGKVTKTIDGDSVILQQNGRNHEIRLWGVDCPEYDQPYGAAAGKLTRRLVGNGSVRVEVKSNDSYGRVVGVLSRGTVNVNEELIRQGAAWVYSQYCREAICGEWRELETAARSQHLGLWHERRPTAPWKWRRRK